MNAWELPTSLDVNGVVFSIRTDFRAILDILVAFASPEYEDDEKWLICLKILFVDFDEMNPSDYEEAMQKAVEFIDVGQTPEDDGRAKPVLMDWEQDAGMIIPAVNRVAGKEVRAMEYLHWWTFVGYYMEVGECAYSQVVAIRSKRAKGEKLEKWERDYLREHKETVLLKRKLTDEERREEEEEERRLEELFG